VGHTYTKFGAELADALERVANDPDLIADPPAALAELGIELEDIDLSEHMDAEALLRAAEAIRVGAVPAFWPWIFFIPWIGFAPEGGQSA
jgi:hypothetical protein